MRVTVAQLDPCIGDFAGNIAALDRVMTTAERENSDLAVFPELYLTGYFPRDLLDRDDFIRAAMDALEEVVRISARHPSAGILLGTVLAEGEPGKGIRNAAVLIDSGRMVAARFKSLLPSYDVFDETRYFKPAESVSPVAYKGQKLGIHICEDAWNHPEFLPRHSYPTDPVRLLADQGAGLFINLSASPFHAGKEKIRYKLIRDRVETLHKPFILVNQTGGFDELIFDGRSFALDESARLIADFPGFEECVRTVDIQSRGSDAPYREEGPIASVHRALILGLRDYMKKCGFRKAVLGLSGGIDSAVVAAIACEAAGPENVLGVAMPSRFSSRNSIEDAQQVAANLGMRFKEIPIENLHAAYLSILAPHFPDEPPGITEENIQARIRGNLLMALSNKFGYLALATGNKSELAMGYCTLYGDMSGGLGVIADVPKTMVYSLAEHMNRERIVIPDRVITKPPSAELRANQKDQDSLPPYDILDPILHLFLDEGASIPEIISRGYDPDTVRHIVRTVWKNEYKRRQAAPGLKVTTKAFGIGRRMPIAARLWSMPRP
jgi:NAD+ synthase (glutamine-hydrolysing)